ncbi:methyltransferase domain-containing protein, partial [Mycobacterium tuberculosis]|nr:methyltransferase domain-containing protein [Mycobacterium tuberculosis]
RGPAQIAATIAATAAGRRFARGLDLGCGTGLMAEALAGRVAHLEGVDLSSAMVAKARAKGLYADLRVADVVADLRDAARPAYD